MQEDNIKNISEISAGLLAVRKDYQQDPEGSDIFLYYVKDIPAYDDETGLFDITVPSGKKSRGSDDKTGQSGNEKSADDAINSLPVYKQMMVRYNRIIAENKDNDDISDLTLFILRTLDENPKLQSLSINCGKAKKKTPPSAMTLKNLLSDLMYRILLKRVPEKKSSRTAGSVVSVRGYIKKTLEITDGDKDEPGYPSSEQIRENTRVVDTFILKKIIENVALVSVHNKVREFFYNCGYREKTGEVTGKIRNKSLAILDRFTREKNISSESLDYIAFAQKSDINALYEELVQTKCSRVFIPVASDCFGNTVIIAGTDRFPLYKFTSDLPNGAKTLPCYFVLQTMQYKNGPALLIPECRPVITKITDSYDIALNELYFLNNDFYDKEISAFNEKSSHIISRYDHRLKGFSNYLDSLTDKKSMDKEIKEILKQHDEEFEKNEMTGNNHQEQDKDLWGI